MGRGPNPDGASRLEARYNLRDAHPDADTYKAQWAAWRTHARARLHVIDDVRPSPFTRTPMDIVLPSRVVDHRMPCFVFLHGGFWRASDKADCTFVALAFAEHGIATAIPNYPLMPQATMSDIVADLRGSAKFLYMASGRLGLKCDRFYVGGYSAGAHLAAWLLATDWSAHGLPADTIVGGMGLSGIFDPRPLLQTTHNETLQLDRETARSASAMRVPEGARPLDFIACGSDETEGFQSQARRYARWAERRFADACPLFWLAGRHHYDVVMEFADPESRISQLTRAALAAKASRSGL